MILKKFDVELTSTEQVEVERIRYTRKGSEKVTEKQNEHVSFQVVAGTLEEATRKARKHLLTLDTQAPKRSFELVSVEQRGTLVL